MTELRFSIAVHEAAHCAAHFALGLPVHGVTLEPAFVDHGEVWPASLTPDELFKYCIATYAGPAGAHLICPGIDDGSAGDERDARKLAKHWDDLHKCKTEITNNHRRDSAAWLTRARVSALALVVRHESAIRAIADMLLEKRSLTGREAHQLFSRAGWPAAALALMAD